VGEPPILLLSATPGEENEDAGPDIDPFAGEQPQDEDYIVRLETAFASAAMTHAKAAV
jgi:hypothetical protein